MKNNEELRERRSFSDASGSQPPEIKPRSKNTLNSSQSVNESANSHSAASTIRPSYSTAQEQSDNRDFIHDEKKRNQNEATNMQSDIDKQPSNSRISSSNKEDYRSKQPNSVEREHQAGEKVPSLNLSSNPLLKRLNERDASIAYIPSLSFRDVNRMDWESRIREYLYHAQGLPLVDIKCNWELNIGMVYLRNENDKHKLVHAIKNIKVGSDPHETVSFVDELELVSYVVVELKNTNKLPSENIVAKCWVHAYPWTVSVRCEVLCEEFPNVFRVNVSMSDKWIAVKPRRELPIESRTADVYFRADCCFLENLPLKFGEDNLKDVINKQISSKMLSKKSIYIQHSKTGVDAVVITCDEARPWASWRLINLDGNYIMKSEKLIYRLKIPFVNENVSVSSIEKCDIFARASVKVASNGKDMIIELLDKTVYEQCLQKRSLNIDGRILKIEAYSLSTDFESWDIDDNNWYETEMLTGKSTIIQFINQPEHPIFRLRWNVEAFLKQFNYWTSTNSQNDPHGDERRHLLRVTVMLNTIGVLKKGVYYTENKEIKLKPNKLKTIVYNHRSKLRDQMTKPLSDLKNYLNKTTKVSVVNEDCLVVYEQLLSENRRPLLLNMANAYTPGGGYRKGDGAQEENIFRRSNYYKSLDMELDDDKPTDRFYCSSDCELRRFNQRDRMYPIEDFGAIYTSGLTVFRQTENNGYAFMKKPMYNVCAIASAAYRNPKLDDNDKNSLSPKVSVRMRKKIENIFAIAHDQQHDCLVLSAFGCGAFRNPPAHVAKIFKSVIEQYAGFFEHIYFAIIDDHNASKEHNPHGNYKPFHDILHNFEVKPMKLTTDDTMIGPWRVVRKANKDELILSDINISQLTPCHYGGKCRELDDDRHCRDYQHPPLCPFIASLGECRLQDDNDHMLWFQHSIKCPNGAKCHLLGDSKHMSIYDHPKNNRANNRNVDNNRDSIPKNEKNVRHSSLPICPFTPFHCTQYTLLSESNNSQSLPSDVQNHCRQFLHVCRFGSQCRNTSNRHLETTIHVARTMCSYADKCSKLHQEDHLNSFSHMDIDDIRHLCVYPVNQCRDRQKHDHVTKYRHQGNSDRSGVIRYNGMNNDIDFVYNQQKIIEKIHKYAEKLNAKVPLTIPLEVQKCIRELLPIYQCSKSIFELILAHGHVLSYKTIEDLRLPKGLIKTIRQNQRIQSIINRSRDTLVEDRIVDYIKARVSYEDKKRQHTKGTTYGSSIVTYDEDLKNDICIAEKSLKGIIDPKDLETIRQSTTEVMEASFNLQNRSAAGNQKMPSYQLGTDNHINTTFAPQIRQDQDDIILVFKRRVMLHPDANFSIQPGDAFINGTAYDYLPWIKDPVTHAERLRQFNESKLHCSILGYEYAAATALMAMAGLSRRTIDVDFNLIIDYLTRPNAYPAFEGHLPNFIPLDYIGEVCIPKSVFTSLTLEAQSAARSIFNDALQIISNGSNQNFAANEESRWTDQHRVEYQRYILKKMTQMFVRNNDYLSDLRGITITLPPSDFAEHARLPFSINQIYNQYILNTKKNSPSNDVYIYWQAMYGDMMVTLSKEPIDISENSKSIKRLICYIAEVPSMTSSDYKELHSYLYFGHSMNHKEILNKRLFLTSSNTFHRGCNVDGFLTYCLRLQRDIGVITLSQAGSNSIYNYEEITHRFVESSIRLNDLNYVYVSAGSEKTPIRNLMVCFHTIPELHPSFDKNFTPGRGSSPQQRPHSSNQRSSVAAEKFGDKRVSSVMSKDDRLVVNAAGSNGKKRVLPPCRYSINCLQQGSEDHCKKYSHPCRFADACHNQDKEPYLTHQPRDVDICVSGKSCKQIDDAYHRASYRHRDLPDFLFPCRDQERCTDKSFKHRMKFSHGEKLPGMKPEAASSKPRKLFQVKTKRSSFFSVSNLT